MSKIIQFWFAAVLFIGSEVSADFLSEENINQSTIVSKLNFIIINLLASIKKYFSTINIYSILFSLAVISNFLFKKKIGNKIFFLNFDIF